MNAKILLLDDDESMTELVGARLRAAGFDIRIAGDAPSGIQTAHQWQPHLILLDLKMPAGGGLAVLKGLQNSIHTKQIPVIVVTGAADDMKSRLREFGIKTYIQKPFQPEELLQAILQVIPASKTVLPS